MKETCENCAGVTTTKGLYCNTLHDSVVGESTCPLWSPKRKPPMQEKIEQIADAYGYFHQAGKAIEECSELIRAIARDERPGIIEELADVQIMIWQLVYLIGCDKQLDDEIAFKIERQLKRMEGDE